MIDVREMTRKPPIFASAVISDSVRPSAKYSWSGAPERFSNGNTATERIVGRCALMSSWRMALAERLDRLKRSLDFTSMLVTLVHLLAQAVVDDLRERLWHVFGQ